MVIYDKIGNVLLDIEVDDTSVRYKAIKGENSITLKFSLAEHIELPLGAYCDFKGERYILMMPEDLTMNHRRSFEYSVVMHSEDYSSRRYMFVNPVDGRLKFSLTAKPIEHLQMFVDNMNARDNGWEVGECPEHVEIVLSYNHTYCYDALVQLADELELDYWFDGKVVNLGKLEIGKDNPLPLSYGGDGEGMKPNINRTNYSDALPLEILYVQGSETNIDPSRYRVQQGSSIGSSSLLLPSDKTIGYDGSFFDEEAGFDASKARYYKTDVNGYSVRRADKDIVNNSEDSLDCTSIEAVKDETVIGVRHVDEEKHFWDVEFSSNVDYREYQIEGETPSIVFQSGMLAGKEFEVATDQSGKIKFYDEQGNWRMEIVPQDIDGITMPDKESGYYPAEKNTFRFFGIQLPKEYISDDATKSGAEWDMFRYAVKHFYANEDVQYTISGELDEIYAKKNWDAIRDKISLGRYISFTDKSFQSEPLLIRITGIKEYVNKPYSPVLEISNAALSGTLIGAINRIENQEVHTEDLFREAVGFTKRRWRDAKETISMLQGALDNFTEGISPITVETMSMLVGDERLQFVFTKSLTSNDSDKLVYAYDDATGVFSVQSAYIKHMTLGIDSISPVHSDEEYKRWFVSEVSQTLEKESAYYLYAAVSKDSSNGAFELHKDVQKDTEDSYYLLVGILNSEYDGLRSFAPMYGYTEVRPGQIVTENIQSADGKTWLDLLRGILHLNDNAGVSGAIDVEKGDKSIAAWFGGLMEDLEFDYNPSSPANTLFRHDGSGYLAKGNIKFNEKGEVELSPNIKISGTGDETLDSILTMLAVLNDMFYFADEETIGTRYNFFSEKENSAGGIGDAIGTSGGGIDPDELEDILNEKGYATEQFVTEQDAALKADIKAKPSSYVPLKTINGLSLYGSGNINVEGGGGSSEGLTAINVNDESFQPDENGIVTLPDYPVVPTFPSALPNPKALTFGSKTYNGSAASTITETDIISDIDTIRAKLASLANYDDAEVKAAIAVLQGYFVGEKSKNADKLDGQDSRYFATASSVSNLSGTVSGLSESVTTLGEDMTDVKGRLATAESEIAANEGNIESQGNDIASLKLRITDAEEDIVDNANGIKDNAEDITDLDRRLDSIELWYNNVGSKFSKDTDGTIKMDGDFYTTGENSAGGVGESVGGTGGGGIDTEELDSILDKKGYATEAWVSKQGYAKGTIPTMVSQLTNDKGYVTASDIPSVPTKVSQLENDAKYLASITASMVKSALGYTPFNESNFSKMNIRTTLGISDWALATTKPTYSYSEIANAPNMSNYATTSDLDKKVDKVSGKGLSTNDYTTTEKNKLASLENYNDSELRKKVNETANEVQTFDDRISDLEDWYSKVGSKFSIDGTAVKVSADFYATGENSAGGQGENIGTGGGGGGLDESELEDYLTDNKYAKQSWVEDQGYAKGTIPTKVSQLENDAKYLASITSAMVTAALGYTPFSTANFTKLNIKNTLGISDWALAASKPTYSYGEIANTPDMSGYVTTGTFNAALAGKVDAVSGKGLSTNDYTNAEKTKLASLENYDDTSVKSDISVLQGNFTGGKAKDADKLDGYDSSHFATASDLSDVASIVDSLKTWYNNVGSKFSKDADGTIKLSGDFFATGENSAGGIGEDIGSIEDFVSRLTEVEAKVNALGSGTKNVAIQVASIITRSSLSSSGMNALGLTLQVAEQMTQGAYNKVIDSSGTYPATWEYSAEKSSTSTVTVYLRKGTDTYKLAYNGTGTWNISKI